MPSAILTENLTKDFPVGFWRRRPRRALDGLSIDIPRGEVFGLLGPNGAGKSTTLKLILNLLWPTSGRAEVLGRPAGSLDARRRLGFLPESPTFYDHLTAEELLVYLAGLCGLPSLDATEKAVSLLDEVGIASDRRRPIRQFSKGMLQRLGLAQALVNDPELVILDEPMSGLDPIGRREVRELILRLRDQGKTIVFSSHILSDAELLCSRVGILARGRLVASGTVAELTSRAAAPGGPAWEVVVDGLTPAVAGGLGGRVRRVTRIADDRYSLELAAETRPEPLIADLVARGCRLISVTALKATLEDVFMSALAQS